MWLAADSCSDFRKGRGDKEHLGTLIPLCGGRGWSQLGPLLHPLYPEGVRGFLPGREREGGTLGLCVWGQEGTGMSLRAPVGH